MSTPQEIEAQNQRFLEALNRGEITLTQYQQAMAYQRQRQAQINLPVTQEPITENPYAQGKSGGQFTYVAVSKEQQKREETGRVEAEKAVAEADRATFMESQATINPTNPQPAPQPHPAREYNTREGTIIVKEGIENVKKTALTTGAILAAPLIGPTGVVIGAGTGLGLSQAAKAASGEGLLSASEAAEAALIGVAFGGAGKAVNLGLKAAGAAKLVDGVGSGAAKVVTGGLGRAGVNAVLGGGAGYALSGGDLEAARDSALLGAGFSIAGDAAIGVIGKVRPVYKGTELTGFKEIELQKASHGTVEIQRLTKPVIREVKLSRAEALYYQKASQAHSKIRMDIAGTEKVMLRGGDEAATYSKAFESQRSFAPVKAALTGERYVYGKVQTGDASQFIQTPTAAKAVRSLKVTSGTSDGKAAVYMKQKVVMAENAVLPETKMVTRDITGVQFRVKEEPAILLGTGKGAGKPAKLPSAIGKHIAAKITAQAPVKRAGSVKGVMKPLDYRLPSAAKSETPSSRTITKLAMASKPKVQAEVKMPKAIVKVTIASPKQVLRLSGVPLTKSKVSSEEYDVKVVSYPQSGLNLPSTLQPIATNIFTPQKSKVDSTQQLATPKASTQAESYIVQPKFKIPVFTKPPIIESTKPKFDVSQTGKSGYTPAPMYRTAPQFRLAEKGGFKPNIMQFTAATPTTLSPPLKNSRVSYPSLRLNSGGGRASQDSLFGRWSEKTNPIKDYKSMLHTFGMGGSSKRRRKL